MLVTLMLAAGNGRAEAARWLVEKGASVELSASGGFTARDFAARKGHAEIAAWLLAEEKEQRAQRAKTKEAAAAAEEEGGEERAASSAQSALAPPSSSASGTSAKARKRLGKKLRKAALEGEVAEVRRLLERGAPVDHADSK